jgi:phosphoribosyl-AMP cyclohydrolase
MAHPGVGADAGPTPDVALPAAKLRGVPGDSTVDPKQMFGERRTVQQVEEGRELAPKFDESGLIPAVTTDYASGELLMVGYMNAEALARTIETGEAHYFSRSRQKLWHKGGTSGLVQKLRELLIDDDQDCVWLRVDVVGGASCHVGYRSCFYRRVPLGAEAQLARGPITLQFTTTEKAFDPKDVYGDAPNPTKL